MTQYEIAKEYYWQIRDMLNSIYYSDRHDYKVLGSAYAILDEYFKDDDDTSEDRV